MSPLTLIACVRITLPTGARTSSLLLRHDETAKEKILTDPTAFVSLDAHADYGLAVPTADPCSTWRAAEGGRSDDGLVTELTRPVTRGCGGVRW